MTTTEQKYLQEATKAARCFARNCHVKYQDCRLSYDEGVVVLHYREFEAPFTHYVVITECPVDRSGYRWYLGETFHGLLDEQGNEETRRSGCLLSYRVPK